MSQASPFAEILEQKISGGGENLSLNDHIHELNNGADPAHLAYLLGQFSPHKVTIKTNRFPYPRPAPKKKKPHVLNADQALAFEQIQKWARNWGQELDPGFSKKELKSMYRFLAKKLHPDLSQVSGEAFILLKKHYDCLIKV
jgi:hypothetical protein